MPRLFLASTASDLDPYHQVVRESASELGWEVTPDWRLNPGWQQDWPQSYQREIETCDLVLALLGWRLDRIPNPERGGDGQRSYLQLELRQAFDLTKPVLILMASAPRRLDQLDNDPELRARLEDFRGELSSIAVRFDNEPTDAEQPDLSSMFEETLRRELVFYEHTLGLERQQNLPATSEATPVLPGDRWASPALEARAGQQTEKTPWLSETRLRHAPPRWMHDRASSEVPSNRTASLPTPGFHLRTWSPPELPARPYPLLLPYKHPELFAGRDFELEELHRLLRLPILILGLHAPSGAGKSSLLSAGLIPRLRAQGQPVAYIRHPNEPRLPWRLLGELYRSDREFRAGRNDNEDVTAFARRLVDIADHAAAAPILILDQFEEMLRPTQHARRARAVLGRLLAATAQRQPGFSGPPCRWLLACRREFHGDLMLFLRDVLRDATAEGLAGINLLPHDLSGPERFHSWAMPLLGSPRAGEEGLETTAAAFRAAIEKPLALRTPEGDALYPWCFFDDGARRLAEAFARARLADLNAPLVPELQVVLACLIDQADHDANMATIAVPDDLTRLIGEALEDHLLRALDTLFPAMSTNRSRLARTRVLLLLRELAGDRGERKFLPLTRIRDVFGESGDDVVETLSGPAIRLLIHEQRNGVWGCLLSHDQMAEVLQRVVESEERSARLVIDNELLELRRLVALSTELFLRDRIRQATAISRHQFGRIAKNTEALLWNDDHRTWWQACQQRQQDDRRQLVTRSLIAALAFVCLAVGTWSFTDRWARRQALLEQIVTGAPAASLAAFDLLSGQPAVDPDALRARLLQQEDPLWMLEAGLDGVDATRRGAVVLQTVEVALPLLQAGRIDREKTIARLVWALDFFPSREPQLAARAQTARDRVLADLRRQHPPPEIMPKDWIAIPGGSFQMGSLPRPALDYSEFFDERPQHVVILSPFRLLAHEVTNREYRRLVPEHPGADHLPVAQVSWYDAYTYAAWLGGRLPTEAEWEYAARADCPHEYCGGDGQEVPLPTLGWHRRNAFDLEALVAVPQPVAQLEPNPWKLFDMRGNVNEWVADWYGEYSPYPQVAPRGPLTGSERVYRGGDIWDFGGRLRAANRAGERPDAKHDYLGFRVALPPEAPTPEALTPEALTPEAPR